MTVQSHEFCGWRVQSYDPVELVVRTTGRCSKYAGRKQVKPPKGSLKLRVTIGLNVQLELVANGAERRIVADER